MKRTFLLAAAATVGLAAPAAAQNVDITGATVATGDGSAPIRNATVSVRGGKVVYAGPDGGAPARETGSEIDGSNVWVTPGLFIPLTNLGLWDVGAVSNSNDISASNSRFSASLDASTAVNYASQHIAISRGGGVTRATVTTAPSDSIFAGQGAVIDLGADPNPVMKPKAFQLVVLGESGARIAGGSRTAAFAEFANALREAREIASGNRDSGDGLLNRADAEALGAVLSGEQQLYVHVERASDISAVLGLKRTYAGLDLVLVGVSEGWIVASEIAASGVPVIADPLDDLPSSFEQLAATQSNVGRMVDAGVKVAIGGLNGGITGPRTAPQFAGNLVALNKVPRASGLSWGEALASITSVPAEISGYGGRYGVLKPGAAGDLVIWDGDPLEVSSAPLRVFIDGVEQPLGNHQMRLRDRYRDLDESDLPKAYDW
ncbi:amidohydrolase family protein [Pontixanthobacter aquaemixtae]|uniref:Amidohydrolase family protein n=1 Tax=Pontixanthobacter aquaemixtae TaxID=1958940 RepID=A0A844ZWH2_9SPHN|nr:amidohydrolase family protein [Pontixanthobacter aquaemixtae]MXO91530.1 amidohydrolase family protein [Pontixanthobacter aquaemixtae]